MLKALSRLSIALGVLCCALWATNGQALAAGGQTGTLRGSVVDQKTGAPIAGASITAMSASGNFKTQTDAQGFFVLLQLPTDTYQLSINKTGYSPQVLQGITVLGDQTQSTGVIRMSPAVATLGTVHVSARSPASAFQPTQTVDETTFVGKRVDQALGEAGSTNYANLVLSAPGVIATAPGSLNPISIRGSASVEIGYQFDGVDYRGVFFDENPSQNYLNGVGGGRGGVQVVSGAGDATQGGIGAGVVNVIPGRGSYPGSGFVSFDVGSPYYNHSMAFQYGIATPDGRFSEFFSSRSDRFAPEIAPYGRDASDAGQYRGTSFTLDDDVLNNFYYRFGKDQDQELQLLVDFIDHRSYAEYGGLNNSTFYPYNPYSYQQFQNDGNGPGSDMWGCLNALACANNPNNSNLVQLQQLEWYQSLIPYLPGVPRYPLGTTFESFGTHTPPLLSGPEEFIYGPTSFLKFGYKRQLSPKTTVNTFFYNWGGQVANNITGTSQALTTGDVLFATGYDPSGGRRVGFQTQLDTQASEKHTLTFIAKFENGFPYWVQLNHGNTWVGLESGRGQDLGNYGGAVNQYGAGPAPVINGPRIEDWFLPLFPGQPVSQTNPCIGPAIDNGFNPSAPTAIGCYIYKWMLATGKWHGTLPTMPRTGFDYHNTDFQQWGIGFRDQYVASERLRLDYGLRIDGQNLKWAPQPFNSDLSDPGDVGLGFATLSPDFLHPSLLEPRFSADFTINPANAVRVSWGRSVSFQFGQTSGTPTGEAGIDPLLFQIPAKDSPAGDVYNQPYTFGGISQLPTGGLTAPGVAGSALGPACGSGWHGPGQNGNGTYTPNQYVPFSGLGVLGIPGYFFPCQNYAASLYWLFDQTFAAPDLGGGFPPTYNNWDVAWGHQFRSGWGSKLTAYWRRGYNTHQVVELNSGPPDPITGQQQVGAFQERETGTEKAFGLEFMLTTPDRPFGWTGFMTINYLNELTDQPPVSGSDSLPPTPQFMLQTGTLFHQAFIAPLSARAGLDYKSRSGWRINPIFDADSGIPFGVGLTSIGFVNGVLYNLPTCNIGQCVPFAGPGSPQASFNATCYSDPAFPGNYFNPHYFACRGNNEPSLAGQAYTHPRVYADLDLEYGRGNHTVGMYITNLFNNYRNEPTVNQAWQPVATGIGGAQSGQFPGAYPLNLDGTPNAAYLGGARNESYYDQPWLPFPETYVPGRTFRFYYQIKL